MKNLKNILFVLLFVVSFQLKAEDNNRPNVIFILADDSTGHIWPVRGALQVVTD